MSGRPDLLLMLKIHAFSLGWAGLGWAGLGWAGLGWAGLGWAGLGWAGLGWAINNKAVTLANVIKKPP
ncbi:hypothetical protein TUM12370_31480 [Salmonella enterica subsp. enterica serovar Choleraesuis]|nr:hypothetical protein TUM12370_31480 [Salmonella enterica subsp. enterica serovar Choleraesuis]